MDSSGGFGSINLTAFTEERQGVSDGRLSPWDDDEEAIPDASDVSAFSGNARDDGRGDLVAKLECSSFLEELGQEMTSSYAAQAGVKASGLLPEVPNEDIALGGGNNDVEGEDSQSPAHDGGSLVEPSHETSDTIGGSGIPTLIGDLCSSPLTARPTTPVHLYQSHKSLYRTPLYHPGINVLFMNKRNVWVHQPPRPSALDFWQVHDTMKEEGELMLLRTEASLRHLSHSCAH
ncbi:uncharacterized protein F5Z01DRAFT_33386 [Emericellopsis atlantica]|uniref:Uncharacterized protein n=1 Tax=Emericellopsis atlantica TaxID=2614577 RepID=A0A9P7ZYE2_9HYPO|nr:uncharacterized protein F5Z01DRAFT_33386 [Emericellopsis atlantica]KAG9259263.1 hypothetical protein F5Z01DRAFT_33386 [Emericellopsis atlantica]